MTATKTLRDVFISGYVTLRNDPCNLCRNGATKLRDKLQEKLPSVTAALLFFFQAEPVENDENDQPKSSKKGRRKPAYAGGLVLEPKKGIQCCLLGNQFAYFASLSFYNTMSALVKIESHFISMGPLQLAVTWYKIRHAGEQAVH